MKKTLLALAAIAASSAAFAQSSVTLYGVVDASLESVKGDDTVTRVSSDNLASSRLGFKGTEDLGNGLKANFVLESNMKMDTGENGGKAVRFFDRAAWVGVAGGFGELRLGRQDTSIGLLAGNSSILGAQAYDDLKISGAFSGNTYRRTDNAITFILPKFVDGLSAQAQYSTAVGSSSATGAENTDKIGSHYGLNVQYAASGFSAGLGYIQAKKTNTVDDTGVLAYLGYDFGVVKLTGYLEQDKTDGMAEKRQLMGARVDVPVSKDFKLQASVAQVKDQAMTANTEDDATIIALKGVYALSKRTSVYALFTNVKNDDQVSLNVGQAVAAGKTARGFAVGLSHKF
ncbi:porin [Aquabacterium sp.]|uniref:porin n=1 Tax=Aquabacterium sp. TaxID=1872578 RepID=UPI002610C545|nr:porin [Aquabacterium sp.]MDD2976628.1 porin [Aquabacterium sp.]